MNKQEYRDLKEMDLLTNKATNETIMFFRKTHDYMSKIDYVIITEDINCKACLEKWIEKQTFIKQYEVLN